MEQTFGEEVDRILLRIQCSCDVPRPDDVVFQQKFDHRFAGEDFRKEDTTEWRVFMMDVDEDGTALEEIR